MKMAGHAGEAHPAFALGNAEGSTPAQFFKQPVQNLAHGAEAFGAGILPQLPHLAAGRPVHNVPPPLSHFNDLSAHSLNSCLNSVSQTEDDGSSFACVQKDFAMEQSQ